MEKKVETFQDIVGRIRDIAYRLDVADQSGAIACRQMIIRLKDAIRASPLRVERKTGAGYTDGIVKLLESARQKLPYMIGQPGQVEARNRAETELDLAAAAAQGAAILEGEQLTNQ